MHKFRLSLMLLLSVALVLGCSNASSLNSKSGAKKVTIGVAFETLQTEYWAAGFDAIKSEITKRDYSVLEAIADSDPNRQLQRVKNFITRRVDGIILVPKDAKSCIPAIRAANVHWGKSNVYVTRLSCCAMVASLAADQSKSLARHVWCR